MLQDVLQWVSQYGYWAICAAMMFGIIGLPIPDETILVFSGYLCSRGDLRLETTLIAGYIGAITGITASYLIGRFGYGVLHKYGRWIHLDDARLEKLHGWYEKYGGWTLVFGYYIAGVRHFSAIVAGTSRLEYHRFAMFAYPAAILWVTIFVVMGRLLGKHWEKAVHAAHRHAVLLAAVLAVGVAVYLGWRYLQRRRHTG